MAKLTEAPPIAETPANPARPARNVTLRPSRSASRPPSSSRLPNARLYAVTTHCRSTVLNPSARCADGNATFITVRSSTTISCARPITPRISHRRRSQPPAVVASDIRITTSISVVTAYTRNLVCLRCDYCTYSATNLGRRQGTGRVTMSPPPDATSPPDATTEPPDPASQPPKRYASQVRDEQARRTRRAIVTAAHDLFLAQGYAATTIDGIAEAAHVSRRTVFNSAGGKVALLKLALDWAIVGDDEPVALADRPAITAIRAESDPRKALMLWVQTVADVAARTAPLGEVLIAAADIDPAAAQLLAEASRNRMLGATLFIRYLASLDGLAAGITEQRAAELCWALTDGHLYRLLVAQRSWSTADFNRWLSDSLAAALLPT